MKIRAGAVLELRQLHYFRAIAVAGSFSKASAELGVAQPALSRQIQHLEDELGTRLLYRNGRGVFLTDSGTQFLRGVQDILLTLETLTQATKEEAGLTAGVVTVGLPPSLAALIAAPLTTRLKNTLPNLQLRVVTGLSGHLNEWILAKQLDVAVLYTAHLSSSIIVEPLLSEYLFLIGATSLVGAAQSQFNATIPMAEAAKVPLILPSAQHALRRAVEYGAERVGAKLSVTMEIDGMEGILAMVLAGHGYSVVPFSGLQHAHLTDKLKVWRLADPEIVNEMVLATPRERFASVAIRELSRAIRAEIAEQLAGGHLAGRMSDRNPR